MCTAYITTSCSFNLGRLIYEFSIFLQDSC